MPSRPRHSSRPKLRILSIKHILDLLLRLGRSGSVNESAENHSAEEKAETAEEDERDDHGIAGAAAGQREHDH